jgi:hypothetical protein
MSGMVQYISKLMPPIDPIWKSFWNMSPAEGVSGRRGEAEGDGLAPPMVCTLVAEGQAG